MKPHDTTNEVWHYEARAMSSSVRASVGPVARDGAVIEPYGSRRSR